MSRQPKLSPPAVTSPPSIVCIEWIDAQSDTDYDGPCSEAGELAYLPRTGYHVNTKKSSDHGPIVVIASEISLVDTTWSCRDIISIPTGWIRKWSTVHIDRAIYPPQKDTPNDPPA